MNNDTNHNIDHTPEELNLFGELRTIPARWDVSSIMNKPHSSNNGRPNLANCVNDVSVFEEGHKSTNESAINCEQSITFKEWYLGAYLDMENDAAQVYWCAY